MDKVKVITLFMTALLVFGLGSHFVAQNRFNGFMTSETPSKKVGVWGTVYAQHGVPPERYGWPWAVITFENEGGSYSFYTTTGGLYWGYLPPGTYTVTARLGWYVSEPFEVTLETGKDRVDAIIVINPTPQTL